MRLMVFFDLPTKTASERKTAARFRKFLISNGFIMLQCSVYIKLTNSYSESERYTSIVLSKSPSEGDVRCLKITEQQYSTIVQDTDPPDYGTDELIEI